MEQDHVEVELYSLPLAFRMVARCIGYADAFKEKYGVSIGPLSVLVLLPGKWTSPFLLLVVLKTRHSWPELLRFVFWDCWVDPETPTRLRVAYVIVIALTAGMCAATYYAVRWLHGSHVR